MRMMSSQKSNAHWDVQVEDVHDLDVTKKTGGLTGDFVRLQGDLQASHLAPSDGGCTTCPLKSSGPRPALQLRNFRTHQPSVSGIRPEAIGLRHGDAEEQGFGEPTEQATHISPTDMEPMMEELPGVKLCWDPSESVAGIELVHEDAADKGLQGQTADKDAVLAVDIRPDAIGVRQADAEERSFGVRDPADQTAQISLRAPEVKLATEEAQGVKGRSDQGAVGDGVEFLDEAAANPPAHGPAKGLQPQTADKASESGSAPCLRMVAKGDEMQPHKPKRDALVEITPLGGGSHLDVPFGGSPMAEQLANGPIAMSPAKKLHELRSAKTLHQQRQNELQRCVADFVRSDELLSCIQRTEDSKALIDGLQDRPGEKDRPYVLSVALKEVQENKLLAQADA